MVHLKKHPQNVGIIDRIIPRLRHKIEKANDMAANGYFAHVGPGGKTPWQWISASGYQYQYAGENLAVRFIDSKDVVGAWMESPTHRANIVKPVYTQIGVGVAEGMYEGQPATYVVQYFGTPKSNAVAAASAAAATPARTGAATAPVPAPTPAAPSVQGAETEVSPAPASAPKSNVSESLGRQLVRAFGEPQHTSTLILSLVSIILVMALLFTFFIHLDIQHPNMLAMGAFVAFVAISFLALNSRLIGGAVGTQSASVIASERGVVITPEAADTGYALFPN